MKTRENPMNTVIDRTNKTILAASMLLVSTVTHATTDPVSTDIVTRSIGYDAASPVDSAVSRAERDTMLKQAERLQNDSIEITGYREENDIQVVMGARYTSTEVILYDASTELISDHNLDGFYHRFSVTIDADTIYPSSYIYAKLYLSYEGGPWALYTISDDFHIHEDSAHDTYTVETELEDGFLPGYYDIRIELYDADDGTWILSYGPYHDDSLAALPLEDSYYDDYYSAHIVPVQTEVAITASGHGHGAMSIGLLLAPLFFVLRRLAGHRWL